MPQPSSLFWILCLRLALPLTVVAVDVGSMIAPAAAEVVLTSEIIDRVSVPVIRIQGEILEHEDRIFLEVADLAAQELRRAADNTAVIHVDLNSPGGDLTAALQIGKLIHKRGMFTRVQSGSRCGSACIFALQSGVSRAVDHGARIGLHRPSYPAEVVAKLSPQKLRDKYDQVLDFARDYWYVMGGSYEAMQTMMSTPSDKVTWISDHAEIVRLGFIGDDPAWYETNLALKVREKKPSARGSP